MLLIAVPVGTLSALYRDRWIDHLSRLLALVGAALPSFWLGLILIDLFSVRLNWLPSMGAGTFKHLILPSLTLGIAMSGVYVRLVRSSLIESLGQDFIRLSGHAASARREFSSFTRFAIVLSLSSRYSGSASAACSAAR